MRRRLITALLLCAALVAPGTALAQDPSIPVPGSTAVPSSSTPAPSSTPVPGAAPVPSSSTPAPSSTATPGAGTPGSTDGSSDWILPAIVGALLLLTALLWGIARWWAWEPRWVLRTRHATAEAGWRTSAAWAEFRDWIRLGR